MTLLPCCASSCRSWYLCCSPTWHTSLTTRHAPDALNSVTGLTARAAQDVIEAEADELSGDKPDREQDLKPFMHSSKARDLRRFSSRCSTDSVFAQTALSGEGDEEEEGGDEDDGIRSWTLRQSSASSLDVLSISFPADLLPVLLPIVDVRASRTHIRRPASHTLPSSGEAA